jgi:hypothetical protein
MGILKDPAPDLRIEGECAGATPLMSEDDQPPDVAWAPSGAFAWSRREFEHLFEAYALRPLRLTRRRILASLGAHMCIRIPSNWY